MEEYDYTNYATIEPWYKDKRHLLLLVGGVILAVAIIVGAVVLARSRARHRSVEDDARVGAAEQIEVGTVACELSDDPEACRRDRVTNVALQFGDLSVCYDLSGESYASCVRLLADRNKDMRVCESLSGDERVACEDPIRFSLAVEDGNLKACEAIESEHYRGSCLNRIRAQAALEGACRQFGVDERDCKETAVADQALEEGSIERCDELSENGRLECRLRVRESDRDHDRLTYDEEVALETDPRNPDTDGDRLGDGDEGTVNTDPRNPDTDGDGLGDGDEVDRYASNPLHADSDGDGFSDGEEVQNGYSPIGAGRLEEGATAQ